jgi:PAS domain S-box-containing protein
MFVVENASEDPRFQDNPLVAGGPGLRFYAGMPLIASGGLAVGTLCVLDTVPKSLTQEQEATLGRLTDSVMRILNLRRDPATAVFARAVDSTGDGITVSVTAEGNDRIVYANESFLELTGCDYHEVIDQPCTFPATEQCPGSWKALQTALCERRPTTAECRLRSRDGRSIWDRISIVPYLDDQGNVLYTVAIHRDITSEKEAEMQTQQLHAMRTTIATVNHVVNNFLNAAQLYSAHVASGAPVDLGMRLAFEAALQNTRRQITDLNRVTKFRDRATPFGVSLLDLSEDPTERGKE